MYVLSNMLPTCIVIGCINSIHNQTVKYYKVPIENQNICRQWYINTLREDLEPSKNHYVCIEHFDEESFLQQQQHQQQHQQQFTNQNQTLKEDAVPSLFEIEVFQKMIQHQELVSTSGGAAGTRSIQTNIQTMDLAASVNAAIANQQQNMQHQQQQQTLLQSLINSKPTAMKIEEQNQMIIATTNEQPQSTSKRQNNKFNGQKHTQRCSIKTCMNSSGNAADDLILYQLPKTTEVAKKWMIACQSHDNDLKLCREHFLPNDFNEYSYLKPDAIPSVFINSKNRQHFSDIGADTTETNHSSAPTTNTAKRARMDPEERAELLSRIPKAVKRTTVQTPQIVADTLNIQNQNANKIQKAVKHTNSIMTTAAASKPTTIAPTAFITTTNSLATSKFLSAALNSSQTISPVKSATQLSSNKQQHHHAAASSNNKANKAVKHTSASALLKEILPPPIMQSTKRTPRAVKHTNSIMSNSSILVTAPAAPVLHHKYKSVPSAASIMNGSRNDILMQQMGIVTQQHEATSVSNSSLTHKTTYVYKKISHAPEIELYLECEDDEQSASLNTSVDENSRKSASSTQIASTNFVSIDKTKLNNSSSSPSLTATRMNDKFKEKFNNSPLNVKPIGSIINANNKLSAKQQQLQKLSQLPAEKRYIQTLLKYYSRIDDDKLVLSKSDNKTVDFATKCNLCDKYLSNNIDFTSHICSHLEGDNYISPFEAVCTTCSVCDGQFRNPFELIMHLDSEHLTQLNEYKCRICERQHKNLNELLAHLNTLHTINEMPYRCDVCTFRTSFYADAIYHIKTFHKETLNFFCPYCLKSILLPYGDKVQHVIVNNFYSHLITHFNKHENNELIESKCKTCRKCILHVRFMKDHLNNDHNNSNNNTQAFTVDEDESPSTQHQFRPGNYRIRKGKVQKAIKSTSGINRQQLGNNNRRVQQLRLLKEQQKPYDQFDLFPLEDDEDDDTMISLIKPINFRIIIKSKDNIKCLECGDGDLHTHFQRSYTCHQCRYGTFCSKSYEYHLHGHLASKRNALWNKLHADAHEYKCECLFETNDGNIMASHLLDCDRKACHTKLAIKTTIDDIEMKDTSICSSSSKDEITTEK